MPKVLLMFFISTIISVLKSSIYIQGKELFSQDLMQILSSWIQIRALRWVQSLTTPDWTQMSTREEEERYRFNYNLFIIWLFVYCSTIEGLSFNIKIQSFYFSQGKIEVTIAGGRVVWENNELKVTPGTGRYIQMPPFSYLFDGLDKKDAIYLNSLQAPVKRAKAST